MPRIDEPDDRRPAPRPCSGGVPGGERPDAGHRPGRPGSADESEACRGRILRRDIQCVVHESSPILGLGPIGRRHTPDRPGFDPDVFHPHIVRPHPGTRCSWFSLKLLASTEPTLNMSYSEIIR